MGGENSKREADDVRLKWPLEAEKTSCRVEKPKSEELKDQGAEDKRVIIFRRAKTKGTRPAADK
jgi:hypothetical protein